MLDLQPIFFFSAFIAGVVMFLAPCTLPLLPAYLGFISGVTEKEVSNKNKERQIRRRVFKNSLMFVLGFSIVFIISGLSFGFIGSIIGPVAGDFLRIMGGLLIISFGLFMMGLLKFSFFEKEIRIKIPKWLHVGSLTSSFLLGSAFAIGWTPCIGPVYGTILIYAGSTNTAFAGAALLATFSLGFSVPLVLLALMFGHTAHFIEKISPYLRIVSVLGGFVLVMLGITFLFGNTGVTNWFFEMFENVDLNKMLMPYL